MESVLSFPTLCAFWESDSGHQACTGPVSWSIIHYCLFLVIISVYVMGREHTWQSEDKLCEVGSLLPFSYWF